MAKQNLSFIEDKKQVGNPRKSSFANKTKIGLKSCTCQCTCQYNQASGSGAQPNPTTPIIEDLSFLTPLHHTPSPRKGGGGILNSPQYMKHIGNNSSLDDMSLPKTPGQDINLGIAGKRERSLVESELLLNRPNKNRKDGRRH